MVEMRWVIREEGNPLRIKVLQYRYQVRTPKKDSKLLEHAWEIKWSEWIDVPTVSEP